MCKDNAVIIFSIFFYFNIGNYKKYIKLWLPWLNQINLWFVIKITAFGSRAHGLTTETPNGPRATPLPWYGAFFCIRLFLYQEGHPFINPIGKIFGEVVSQSVEDMMLIDKVVLIKDSGHLFLVFLVEIGFAADKI